MPKRCCSCCFIGQRKIARFSAFANYTGARPPRGASQSADARSGIGLALDSTCPETLSAFANYNCPLLLSPRHKNLDVPGGAAVHDRPSAEEMLRAAVYWFSWLFIQGLLAITVPLCWFGKELVAGR